MEIDYEKLGFRCGIEIHQQIDSHKLFCNCPPMISDEDPDFTIKRSLKASASELGEIDIAAKHEMAKKKTFVYEACNSNACLVELDEEPPGKVNKEALKIALEIALLLKAKIADNIIFMRKIVIDGSNVSGFQRTALIASNGQIQTSKGTVKIPTIQLEEEAAKKISQNENEVKYRLDRMGISLVEIATDDSIVDAEHAKEVAEKIGMVLRSTGKVLRGLGTIRQDVNVSIKNGARTEIKGFQDLKAIPKVINFEINRQVELIKKGKILEEEVRKAEPDFTTSFLRPLPGAARLYPETDVDLIKVTDDMLKTIILPELISDKLDGLEKKYGIRKDIIGKLIKEQKFELFEKLTKENKNIKNGFLADFLLSFENEVKKNPKADTNKIKNGFVEEVIKDLNDGKISKNSLNEIMIEASLGHKFEIKKYLLADDKGLESEIKKIVDVNKGKNIGTLMGIIMGKYKGKADGKKVKEILDRIR